jgi:hypothetical protein
MGPSNAVGSAEMMGCVRDPAGIDDGDNWTGGFYELAIELGPRDDARLQAALDVLGRVNGADGYFAAHGPSAGRQHLTLDGITRSGHLRGVTALPTGARVVCGVFAIREDEGPDWLVFYLPLEALCRVDRRIGGFPFDERSGPESLVWREPLDDWLVGIGRAVFSEVPFELGLVGFETSGEAYARDLAAGAPPERWSGFLLPEGDRLSYSPANR